MRKITAALLMALRIIARKNEALPVQIKG